MAQIVRKKDDNMVLFLFDDLDNITVNSDGLSVNLCSTPKYQVDMTGSLVTDTDYEILTVVQPHLPRRFYGVEVDKWDRHYLDSRCGRISAIQSKRGMARTVAT